jgi:hypothetical protein
VHAIARAFCQCIDIPAVCTARTRRFDRVGASLTIERRRQAIVRTAETSHDQLGGTVEKLSAHARRYTGTDHLAAMTAHQVAGLAPGEAGQDAERHDRVPFRLQGQKDSFSQAVSPCPRRVFRC